MSTAIYSFPELRQQAECLARELCCDCFPISVRHFPDGESLICIPETVTRAFVYRSLNHPNEKLVELVLAAATLRSTGSSQIILVAPYLAYMRQDIAFNQGEAVSQRIVGGLLSAYFDGVVTVDPHLHRTLSLGDVLPGKIAIPVSAAATLAALLGRDLPKNALLVGPDSESRPWVENIAGILDLEVLIGRKVRLGDRSVAIEISDVEHVSGRHVVLVDDVISSGQTLIECARLCIASGAAHIEAVATHCLAGPDDLAAMKAGGIARIRTTDTIAGPTAEISIAKAIAQAVRKQGIWLDDPHL
ncbi:ribose-phosphate diphosphokinase [Sphingorhabdus sp.]|uniref:ribose-phosphate diphosphokinase n=1 Tax=Sphingorhabdus sp. TaxID=1902408 RepID=UPI0035ADB53C